MILKQIRLKKPMPAENRFPFGLPVVREFDSFTFRSPVTIIAGGRFEKSGSGGLGG